MCGRTTHRSVSSTQSCWEPRQRSQSLGHQPASTGRPGVSADALWLWPAAALAQRQEAPGKAAVEKGLHDLAGRSELPQQGTCTLSKAEGT